MSGDINQINQILIDAPAGRWNVNMRIDNGEKTLAIRRRIRSVLGKIIHYKAEHQHVLDEAATALQFALPRDFAVNNVLPFLKLPPTRLEWRIMKKRR